MTLPTHALSAVLLRASAALACLLPTGCVVMESHSFVDLKGTFHKPLEVRGPKAHVLFFITTDCPIANGYAPEIQAIADAPEYAGVKFLLVHVDPELRAPGAEKHAAEYGLKIPAIFDQRHLLASRLGITITPEVAVLDADSDLVYRGRIDDLYGDIGKKRLRARKRDLRVALSALLAGETIETPRTEAVGCDLPDPTIGSRPSP